MSDIEMRIREDDLTKRQRYREEDEAEAKRIKDDPHLRYAVCRLLQVEGDMHTEWHAYLQESGIRNPNSASTVWDELYNESRLTS